MSERGTQTRQRFLAEAAVVGKVVLGAAAGAAGGLVAGWFAFESLTTALLGMLGGAVAGMIGAAVTLERDQR
ncbi:MAG: hypothetical protein L0Z62_18960 [Gemmataceae bacterium]|nr:hypothetical protein [Gemmataceae bacterium]